MGVAVHAMTLSKTNFSIDPFKNSVPPGDSKNSSIFNKQIAVMKLYSIGHGHLSKPMADEYWFIDHLRNLS